MPFHVADLIEIEYGDGVPESAVAITTAVPSAGVVTVTATGVNAADGDAVLIAGSTGIDGLNGFHAVTAPDANSVDITNGNLTGTLGTPGTVQVLNGATWAKLASVREHSFSQAGAEVTSPDYDDLQSVVEHNITTFTNTGSFTLNYRPTQVSHGMVSGLGQLHQAKKKVWWRLRLKNVDPTTPPYRVFLASIGTFEETGARDGVMDATMSLLLDTFVMAA